MSEATKELTAEARAWRENQLPQTPWGDGHIVNRLADALESATRVPVQGEPNDGLVLAALNAYDPNAATPNIEDWGEESVARMRRVIEVVSRATVPDAATERVAELEAGPWLPVE